MAPSGRVRVPPDAPVPRAQPGCRDAERCRSQRRPTGSGGRGSCWTRCALGGGGDGGRLRRSAREGRTAMRRLWARHWLLGEVRGCGYPRGGTVWAWPLVDERVERVSSSVHLVRRWEALDGRTVFRPSSSVLESSEPTGGATGPFSRRSVHARYPGIRLVPRGIWAPNTPYRRSPPVAVRSVHRSPDAGSRHGEGSP